MLSALPWFLRFWGRWLVQWAHPSSTLGGGQSRLHKQWEGPGFRAAEQARLRVLQRSLARRGKGGETMTLQRLIQDARREGKIEALVELYLSGDLPLSMAANKSGRSEEEFLERAKISSQNP